MKSILREAGYKATPGRLALIELLRKSEKPLSIEEITKAKKMDKVTAYRILEVLQKIGLVRRVDLRHGHADYEFAGSDDHHHLVCVMCGKIEDFEGCNMDSLARKAIQGSKKFAKITQHSLEFFGVCKACALKKA